jgi:hypothetical protein
MAGQRVNVKLLCPGGTSMVFASRFHTRCTRTCGANWRTHPGSRPAVAGVHFQAQTNLWPECYAVTAVRFRSGGGWVT